MRLTRFAWILLAVWMTLLGACSGSSPPSVIMAQAGAAGDAHRADGDDSDWVGVPSHISGTSVVSRGEFIYTDYVHDDSGANVDGLTAPNPDLLNPITGIYPNLQDPTAPWIGGTGNMLIDRFRHSGDYAYAGLGPAGAPLAFPGGYYDVADLLELRLAVSGRTLHVLARLGAMTAPDSAGLALCLDTDRDAGTGLASWPRNANLHDPLGCDLFVTLWGTGGELIDARRTPATVSALKSVAANPKARPPFIEADIPLPEGVALGVWRVYAGTGLWDAAGQKFAAPPLINVTLAPGNLFGTAPNLYDLAFQGLAETNDYWRDTDQSNALVGQDISPYHADVDLGLLAAGGSTAPPKPTGLLDIQYPAQPLDDGQGESTNFSGGYGTFVYKGPVQPYMLLLPSDYYTDLRPRPLLFFFHPSNVNHNIWAQGVESSATPHTVLVPRLGTEHVQAIVDQLGMMVAGTLQRGEKGPAGPGLPWSDIPGVGERDLRDVFATLTGRDGYLVDPDRIVYSGMSYGGQTTQTMMTLYPDELAAAVAYDAPGTGVPARLENLRDLYYAHVTGDTGLDATAPIFGRQASQQIVDLGYRHLYLEFIGRAHDFNLVYESLPIIEQTAYRAVRDPNPARVTYTLDRAIEEGDAAQGLRHDHAYWASGLVLAEGSAQGHLDAIALPLAAKLPKMLSRLTGTFLNPLTGSAVYVIWQEWDRDLHGHGLQDFQDGWIPLPDVQVTNQPQSPLAHAGENAFVLTTDLAGLTLDLPRMGIAANSPIRGDVQAAHPLALRLRPPPGLTLATARLDGAPLPFTLENDTIVLTLPSGAHTIELGN
jgi:hypothetical protein